MKDYPIKKPQEIIQHEAELSLDNKLDVIYDFLRKSYLTNLTVDCIGKALLRCVETDYCDCYYELSIPNDIDLICCLQLTVSTLINDQIVVLGSTTAIQPRVVDTFSKVCDFSTCPGDTESANNNNNNSCGCKH